MKPLRAFILAIIEMGLATLILKIAYDQFPNTQLFLYLWLAGIGLITAAIITVGIIFSK
ncbi:MAG: hypothetical protein PXY39_05475 [archaeon]|nr:hypothetical protein [archaeon]